MNCPKCGKEMEIAESVETGRTFWIHCDQKIEFVIPTTTRPAMTPEVSQMAQRLTHKPSTMSTSNDAHIILDKELRRDIDAIIQRLKEGGLYTCLTSTEAAPSSACLTFRPPDNSNTITSFTAKTNGRSL